MFLINKYKKTNKKYKKIAYYVRFQIIRNKNLRKISKFTY